MEAFFFLYFHSIMPDGEFSELPFEKSERLVRRIFPFVVSAENGGFERKSPSAERKAFRFSVNGKDQLTSILFHALFFTGSEVANLKFRRFFSPQQA